MPTWLTQNHYLTLGLLLGCTVIGIIFAARFRREVDVDLAPPTQRDLLDPLEEAYYSGLMRPEEIERVRASIKKGATPAPPPPPSRAKPPADGAVFSGGDGPVAAPHPPGDPGGGDA